MSEPIKIQVGDKIEAYGDEFYCVMVTHKAHDYPEIRFISKAEADLQAYDRTFVTNQEVYRREMELALHMPKEARGFAEGQCNAISPNSLGRLYCKRPPAHPPALPGHEAFGYGPRYHVNGTKGWE